MTIVYDFADIAARMNHKPVRTEPVAPTGTGSLGCYAWDDDVGDVVWVPSKSVACNPEPGPAVGLLIEGYKGFTTVDEHILAVTSLSPFSSGRETDCPGRANGSAVPLPLTSQDMLC